MYPRPFVAPSISATTIATNPLPADILNPSRSEISDNGIFMWRYRSFLLAPQFCAAPIMSLSTALNPAVIDEIIGYMEFQSMTNILGLSPMPIITMNSGNSAIDGIFFVALTIGIIRLPINGTIEQITAMQNPITSASINPDMTILDVYSAWM